MKDRKHGPAFYGQRCKAGPCRAMGTTRGPTKITGTLPKWFPRLRQSQGYDLIDAAKSFLVFGGCFVSGCVLRTASLSISRSSAFVFGGSRAGLCHWVMNYMWGCRRVNYTPWNNGAISLWTSRLPWLIAQPAIVRSFFGGLPALFRIQLLPFAHLLVEKPLPHVVARGPSSFYRSWITGCIIDAAACGWQMPEHF
jgi:hypothetical protein